MYSCKCRRKAGNKIFLNWKPDGDFPSASEDEHSQYHDFVSLSIYALISFEVSSQGKQYTTFSVLQNWKGTKKGNKL